MPNLTLYLSQGACSFVPHSLLLHLNIPHKTVAMKLGPEGYSAADGSFDTAEYKARIHPSGYVPALAVDDEVITELPALLFYIASLSDNNLVPQDGLQRARVAEWLNLLSGTLHGYGFAMMFRPQRFVDDEALHDTIRAKGRTFAERILVRINKAFEKKDFAVGDALTVADFYLYVFARWGKVMEMDMEANYPNYVRFAHRMEQVDGVKKAIAAEGLDFSY